MTPIRIGNASGFYGDRFSALREMVTGGAVDVVTGDYLAELTMLILGRDRAKDPALGYARTYLRQVADCLGEAMARGVRLVSNAGGVNPTGLADRIREVAAEQGLTPRIAVVTGDDLMPVAADHGWSAAITANAYLGAFGIAAALRDGADIVVTGRVTDASLVVGPAAARHGWSAGDLDALAGAVVAGHVIECGTQATGGNFAGFLDLPRDGRPLGFPIAEVAADGSSVITKHPGTGGAVTIDTVTAQLLYEVGDPAYLGPDVVAHLDSVRLSEDGPDRVRISGVVGTPPPPTLKVCLNELGGFRNAVELVVTGLDVEAKAAWVQAQLEEALGARRPAVMEWQLARTDRQDAATTEEASARLRVVVKDPDPARVGRSFSGAVVELALASYPGFTATSPPAEGTPFGIFRSASVPVDQVRHTVVHADGRDEVVPPAPATAPLPPAAAGRPATGEPTASGPTVRMPLGRLVLARSGDKGGDANVGLWVPQGERADARYAWLAATVTSEYAARLVPECAAADIEVHRLPNLRGVNIVLHGLLGDGVAASTRFDPQAKALGEWLRSRVVEIPQELT